MVDYLVGRIFGWLDISLVGWISGWLVGHFAGWLDIWLVGYLVGRIFGWSDILLVGWDLVVTLGVSMIVPVDRGMTRMVRRLAVSAVSWICF